MSGTAAELDQLRDYLASKWLRVRDVFVAWDEDESGTIERGEWLKALKALLRIEAEDANRLFDLLDVDGSGALEYNELHKELRMHAVELDEALRDGAMGEIELASKNRYELRKDGPQTDRSRVVTLDLGEGDSVQDQIANALASSWSRVRDLFLEWDEDGDGSISKREFVRALALLGLHVGSDEAGALFDAFDADLSGTVDFEEMSKALRRRATVEIDAKLQAGAVQFERQAKNKIATRKNGPGKTGSNVLSGVTLSGGGGVDSMVTQLRAALAANLGRTLDLYGPWPLERMASSFRRPPHASSVPGQSPPAITS